MLKLIRILLVTIIIALGSFIGIFVSLCRPFNSKNVVLVMRPIALLCFKILGIKIVIKNKEILKNCHPSVLVSNHQSSIDVLIGSVVASLGTASVGKSSIKYIPIFGQFYWLSGNILINRKNIRHARKTLDRVGLQLKKKHFSVWIMPEGTRGQKPGLLPFKKGAFHVAVSGQLPIIPVCISSYKKSLNLNRLKSGTIHIEVVDPIPTKSLSKLDIPQLLTKTRDIMESTINRLDQSTYG